MAEIAWKFMPVNHFLRITNQTTSLERSTTTRLSGIQLPPSQGHAHSHTVVFLHGRGDSAENLANALRDTRDSQNHTLLEAFPSFRWMLPQAPRRTCVNDPDAPPVNQWFEEANIVGLKHHEGNQAAEGLKQVVPQIRDILTKEAGELGDRWDKVILMGIGMGCGTSVHTLLNLEVPTADRRLGAFVGFSGRCPFAGQSLDEMRQTLQLEGAPAHNEVLRKTPILLEHCADNATVLVELGWQQREILRAFGANVFWREYHTGGHCFKTPQGMDDVVEFLNNVL